MGKRSDFKRRAMDEYATPYAPVVPLIPFLHRDGIRRFVEPCAGDGDLVGHLRSFGFGCAYDNDLKFGADALALRPRQFDRFQADAIITNPPWTREILHPMIDLFQRLAPTWLLFDADWAHTRQAVPYLPHCSQIVSVGRVKWIANSKHSGKDNAAWYRFDIRHHGGPIFVGKVTNQWAKSNVGEFEEAPC